MQTNLYNKQIHFEIDPLALSSRITMTQYRPDSIVPRNSDAPFAEKNNDFASRGVTFSRRVYACVDNTRFLALHNLSNNGRRHVKLPQRFFIRIRSRDFCEYRREPLIVREDSAIIRRIISRGRIQR